MKRSVPMIVLGVFVCFTGTLAQTENVETGKKQLHLLGCPVPGVEGGCLMLVSQNKKYDITAAPAKADPPGTPADNPRPDRKPFISVDANHNPGGMSPCMQAPLLKDIDWSYTKRSCPKNLRKKAHHTLPETK